MTTLLKFDPVFDAQSIFRDLLHCMSRPGEVKSRTALDLPVAGSVSTPGQLAVALAFLNMDSPVSFPEGDALSEFIRNQTGAPMVEPSRADFIFTDASQALQALQLARDGDPLYPETCPTLVISVPSLEEPGNGVPALVLTGPGISGQCKTAVGGLSEEFWVRRMERNVEFPLGVDLIFCAEKEGQSLFLCLPRTTAAHLN